MSWNATLHPSFTPCFIPPTVVASSLLQSVFIPPSHTPPIPPRLEAPLSGGIQPYQKADQQNLPPCTYCCFPANS